MQRFGIKYVIALTICIIPILAPIYAEKSVNLTKLGHYRYNHNFFLKIYDVTLYSIEPFSREKLLSGDVPIKLEFTYLREIQRNDIIKVSNRMLEKNLSAQEILALNDHIKSLHSAYRTVRKGDTSILHYSPSNGTTLIINGMEIIQIPSKQTCLYFRIWLGDDPISLQMRETLISYEE